MSKTENEQKYPGSAIKSTAGEKVTANIRQQYTKGLNNNPRNDR